MSMKVKLWGVRGSLPTPHHPDLLKNRIENHINAFAQSGKTPEEYIAGLKPYQTGGYGGNTACFEIKTDTTQLIVDGGSGLRGLGDTLLSGPCGQGKGEVDMLFTHFHWDHLVGLPFFVPFFIPGNVINVYSVQDDLEEIFRHIFRKPYFPVPYERLGSTIKYHKLAPREAKMFGDLKVTPYQLDHPDPCWGFKFEKDGKAISYCVDTECVRTSQEDLGPDLALYQGIDLMIFDAQYTFQEALEKVDWGHASAPVGLDVALREGVKRIVFIHHDPAAPDEKIFEAELQTSKYYKTLLAHAEKLNLPEQSIEWEFGVEGFEAEI